MENNFTSVPKILEKIVGCKWSMQILGLIRHDICRPGAIKRSIPGLTTKVQSDCLQRMVLLGILERIAYPEIPPRVEYRLSEFGQHFVPILDAVENLQHEYGDKIEMATTR